MAQCISNTPVYDKCGKHNAQSAITKHGIYVVSNMSEDGQLGQQIPPGKYKFQL